MEQSSFGYWLRLKRKAFDLTREELAQRVGYSAATIRKIEDEERHPSVQAVERLADFFNIPQDERIDFLRFARGDWKFVPHENEEELPWRPAAKPQRSNLPATTTSLIAREQEIALVREYLLKDDIRLVTLMGPPGIGKTRLSIEAARVLSPDFPDGVFFVALAPLAHSSLIATIIAQSLGYVGAKNISTTEQLKEGIGDEHMLIVLDNCEHLVEDVALLAADLLSACARLKMLTTSRESLRIPGEWLYPVPAFEIPLENSSIDIETASNFPALTLFAERARAVRPDFTLNAGNIRTVSAICARLDGLPLGIELIAARMRLMSPQALLERMNDQFVLAADGMRAASARQKTLNHAIGWSYNLLSSEEQNLFAGLSVFAGGFTVEAVEWIFSTSVTKKSVSELIALLLDKSLLQAVPNHESRFTMLVTIQQFARERLQDMGKETEMRNRHFAYFLQLAKQADQELHGQDQLASLRRLETARDNLRTALTWAIETAQTEAALQMVRKLHWFWFVRGDHTEGRQWLGRVLSMPDVSTHPEAYAEALTQMAHHTWVQSGFESAKPYVEQALTLAREHNDKHNIARGLAQRGVILVLEDHFTAAQAVLEESKTLFQEVGDEWGYAHAVIILALGAFRQDDVVTALSLHEESLRLFRKLGEKYFEAVSLRFIGILKGRQGDASGGIASLQESLRLVQQLNSIFEISVILAWLGESAERTGHFDRAVCLYFAGKSLAASIGVWSQQDEDQLQSELAPSRAALREVEFADAVERGVSMTMEQAIAYALEDAGD